MTDKSAFTQDEWHALTEAPLLIAEAVFLVGEHGPISMLKEASASARAITHPGEHQAANALIGEIVAEANTKEARAEAKKHRGPTPEAAIEGMLVELQAAATALKKLPSDEAEQVAAWFVSIAETIARSAKTVNPSEDATISKIATTFGVERGSQGT